MNDIETKVNNCYSKMPYPNTFRDSGKDMEVVRKMSDWLCSNFDVLFSKKDRKRVKTILVVGCGTGEELYGINEYFNPKKIVAIDLNRKALDIAKSNVNDFGIKNVEFRQMSILKDLPSYKNTFDLVISVGVLHHLADPKLGVKIVSDKVNKKGFLVLSLYNTYGLAFHKIRLFLLDMLAGEDMDKRVKLALKFGFHSGDSNSSLYDSYANPQVKTFSIGSIITLCRKHKLILKKTSPPLDIIGLITFGVKNSSHMIRQKFHSRMVLSLFSKFAKRRYLSTSYKVSFLRAFLFQILFLIFRKGECFYLIKRAPNEKKI